MGVSGLLGGELLSSCCKEEYDRRLELRERPATTALADKRGLAGRVDARLLPSELTADDVGACKVFIMGSLAMNIVPSQYGIASLLNA